MGLEKAPSVMTKDVLGPVDCHSARAGPAPMNSSDRTVVKHASFEFTRFSPIICMALYGAWPHRLTMKSHMIPLARSCSAKRNGMHSPPRRNFDHGGSWQRAPGLLLQCQVSHIRLISATQSSPGSLGTGPNSSGPPPAISRAASTNSPVRGLNHCIENVPEAPLKSNVPVCSANGR